MSDIKLPLVATSDHPEFPVLAWSRLEIAAINRLMREAVRLNARGAPDGDAAEAVHDTNAVLASRYFELLKVVEAYEKHGVTCQTFRHFVDTPCAECNCAPAAPQPARQDDEGDALTIAYLHGHGKGKDSVQPVLAEKDALLRQALNALEGFSNITNDSQGVAGYHLSGDTAEWDEFDEVDAASNTIEAIRNHLGVKND